MASRTSTLGRFGPVALALMCAQIDFFALMLALPNMSEELEAPTTELQWAVSGYMIALGCFMIPASRLADLVGRKRILLLGLMIFGLSSLWCGLSPSVISLNLARIVQGLGAAMFFPVSFALVTNSTNPQERPRVLGFLAGIAGVGMALGPILGGGLAATVGWRWIFFVNLPLALGAALWGWRSLTESRDESLTGSSRSLDWFGVALIAVGVGCLSIGVDGIPADGILSLRTLGLMVLGVAFLGAFWLWESRARNPLVSHSLMRIRSYSLLLIAGTVSDSGTVVLVFVSTMYLQIVIGASGLVAGLMFVPAAIALAVGGPISGRLEPLFPGARVMTVTMISASLFLIILSSTGSVPIYLLFMAASALFLGLGFEFTNLAIQNVVPESRSGEASSVLLTVMFTTGGIAVVAAQGLIEVIGDGGVSAEGTSLTLLVLGVVIGTVGAAFGIKNWRNAKHASTGVAAAA